MGVELRNHIIILLAATAMLVSPVIAQAQSCYDLRVQRNRLKNDMLGIAMDFPKTHMALAACLANNSEEDAKGCAATMLIGACLWMGSSDCSDLLSRWYRVVSMDQTILAEMRREGCGL